MSETTFSSQESGVVWPQGEVSTFMSDTETDPYKVLHQPGLIAAAKSVKPGTFLLDKKYLPGISDLATSAHFVEIEEHRKTREASGHGVLFGQLMLHSVDDGEHSLFVAVKPLDEPEEAAQEYGVGSFFADGSIPGVTGFRPLGFYRFESGQPAVVTHYRHPVRSLDTILWNPESLDNRLMTAKAMGRAATSMAALHTNHWIRGDAQAKNFAWDITQPTGDTFLIDVETLEPFPIKDGEIDEMETADLVNKDIEAFVGSLFLPRDMGFELPEDYEQRIKHDFGIVYSGYYTDDPHNMIPSYDDVAQIVDEQTRFGAA